MPLEVLPECPTIAPESNTDKLGQDFGGLTPQQHVDALKRRRRQFQPQDIVRIAELVADLHTEQEACSLLGFRYDSWLNYKSKQRHKSSFEEHFTRLRAEKIRANVKTMKKASLRDWRAADRLNEHMSRERFGDKVQIGGNTMQLNVFQSCGLDINRMVEDVARAKQLQKEKQVKVIAEQSQPKE